MFYERRPLGRHRRTPDGRRQLRPAGRLHAPQDFTKSRAMFRFSPARERASGRCASSAYQASIEYIEQRPHRAGGDAGTPLRVLHRVPVERSSRRSSVEHTLRVHSEALRHRQRRHRAGRRLRRRRILSTEFQFGQQRRAVGHGGSSSRRPFYGGDRRTVGLQQRPRQRQPRTLASSRASRSTRSSCRSATSRPRWSARASPTR